MHLYQTLKNDFSIIIYYRKETPVNCEEKYKPAQKLHIILVIKKKPCVN